MSMHNGIWIPDYTSRYLNERGMRDEEILQLVSMLKADTQERKSLTNKIRALEDRYSIDLDKYPAVTREEGMDSIASYLDNDSVNVVAIVGKVSAGKTELVKNIREKYPNPLVVIDDLMRIDYENDKIDRQSVYLNDHYEKNHKVILVHTHFPLDDFIDKRVFVDSGDYQRLYRSLKNFRFVHWPGDPGPRTRDIFSRIGRLQDRYLIDTQKPYSDLIISG